MLKVRDPLDIDAAMKEQKDKCDELLLTKNNLVDFIKNDLKNMDIAYYEDLEKQVGKSFDLTFIDGLKITFHRRNTSAIHTRG